MTGQEGLPKRTHEKKVDRQKWGNTTRGSAEAGLAGGDTQPPEGLGWHRSRCLKTRSSESSLLPDEWQPLDLCQKCCAESRCDVSACLALDRHEGLWVK